MSVAYSEAPEALRKSQKVSEGWQVALDGGVYDVSNTGTIITRFALRDSLRAQPHTRVSIGEQKLKSALLLYSRSSRFEGNSKPRTSQYR